MGVVPVLDHPPNPLETLLLLGVPPSITEPLLHSGII